MQSIPPLKLILGFGGGGGGGGGGTPGLFAPQIQPHGHLGVYMR